MSLVAACHTWSGSQLTGHVSTHFPGRDDVLSHVDRKGIASQPQSLRRLDSSTPVSRYPLDGPGSLSLAFDIFHPETGHTDRSRLSALVFIFLLIPVVMLRRTGPHAFGHSRIGSRGGLRLDGNHIDLMPPIIAEIEPVAQGIVDV